MSVAPAKTPDQIRLEQLQQQYSELQHINDQRNLTAQEQKTQQSVAQQITKLTSPQLDANFYQTIPSLHGAEATGAALFAVAGHPAYEKYLQSGHDLSESPGASAARDAAAGVSSPYASDRPQTNGSPLDSFIPTPDLNNSRVAQQQSQLAANQKALDRQNLGLALGGDQQALNDLKNSPNFATDPNIQKAYVSGLLKDKGYNPTDSLVQNVLNGVRIEGATYDTSGKQTGIKYGTSLGESLGLSDNIKPARVSSKTFADNLPSSSLDFILPSAYGQEQPKNFQVNLSEGFGVGDQGRQPQDLIGQSSLLDANAGKATEAFGDYFNTPIKNNSNPKSVSSPLDFTIPDSLLGGGRSSDERSIDVNAINQINQDIQQARDSGLSSVDVKFSTGFEKSYPIESAFNSILSDYANQKTHTPIPEGFTGTPGFSTPGFEFPKEKNIPPAIFVPTRFTTEEKAQNLNDRSKIKDIVSQANAKGDVLDIYSGKSFVGTTSGPRANFDIEKALNGLENVSYVERNPKGPQSDVGQNIANAGQLAQQMTISGIPSLGGAVDSNGNPVKTLGQYTNQELLNKGLSQDEINQISNPYSLSEQLKGGKASLENFPNQFISLVNPKTKINQVPSAEFFGSFESSLNKINPYLGFGVSTVGGLGSTIIGGLVTGLTSKAKPEENPLYTGLGETQKILTERPGYSAGSLGTEAALNIAAFGSGEIINPIKGRIDARSEQKAANEIVSGLKIPKANTIEISPPDIETTGKATNPDEVPKFFPDTIKTENVMPKIALDRTLENPGFAAVRIKPGLYEIGNPNAAEPNNPVGFLQRVGTDKKGKPVFEPLITSADLNPNPSGVAIVGDIGQAETDLLDVPIKTGTDVTPISKTVPTITPSAALMRDFQESFASGQLKPVANFQTLPAGTNPFKGNEENLAYYFLGKSRNEGNVLPVIPSSETLYATTKNYGLVGNKTPKGNRIYEYLIRPDIFSPVKNKIVSIGESRILRRGGSKQKVSKRTSTFDIDVNNFLNPETLESISKSQKTGKGRSFLDDPFGLGENKHNPTNSKDLGPSAPKEVSDRYPLATSFNKETVRDIAKALTPNISEKTTRPYPTIPYQQRKNNGETTYEIIRYPLGTPEEITKHGNILNQFSEATQRSQSISLGGGSKQLGGQGSITKLADQFDLDKIINPPIGKEKIGLNLGTITSGRTGISQGTSLVTIPVQGIITEQNQTPIQQGKLQQRQRQSQKEQGLFEDFFPPNEKPPNPRPIEIPISGFEFPNIYGLTTPGRKHRSNTTPSFFRYSVNPNQPGVIAEAGLPGKIVSLNPDLSFGKARKKDLIDKLYGSPLGKTRKKGKKNQNFDIGF